jgi:transposase
VDTLTTDLDGPGRDVQVGRKCPYPEEFRRDAVALYRAAAGKRTYAAVAADFGITAESPRTGSAKTTHGPCPDTATWAAARRRS